MAPLRPLAALIAIGAVLLTGCGAGPETIDPSGVDGLEIPTASPDQGDFVSGVDNPYLPLRPGTAWGYTVVGDRRESRRVSVTGNTRVVAGVRATVVRDVLTSRDGKLLRDTYTWFAQDRAGNVWQFGEDSRTRNRRGFVTPEGRDSSWEAGVDGAEAGLAMPAVPRIGDGFETEMLAGAAEDRAVVLSVDEVRDVAGTSYDDLLVLEATTPLEPGVVERQYFARGTGLIYQETVSGGAVEVELVAFTEG